MVRINDFRKTELTLQRTGFFKIRFVWKKYRTVMGPANFVFRGKMILDAVNLETEPWLRETTGFWIDVPKPILELMRLKNINAAESIHAAQHAFLNQFDMAADLRTECKLAEKEYRSTESQRKRPGR